MLISFYIELGIRFQKFYLHLLIALRAVTVKTGGGALATSNHNQPLEGPPGTSPFDQYAIKEHSAN